MTDQVQTNEDVQLTINDLMVMRAVLDTSTQAGIFKAADLSTLGMTFDKLNMICEDFIAKNQKSEGEPAAAE